MSDHLDYIRIIGLEDADTEVFQAFGSSVVATSTGTPGVTTGLPGLPIGTDGSVGGVIPSTQTTEKQAAYDLSKVWAAQQRFISNLISYLSKLEPGENSDAESIINDYVKVLSSVNSLKSSTTAYDISIKAASELPIIWETINRQPPKELTKWIETADTWGKDLEKWFNDGLGALYAQDEANDAISAAQLALSQATTPEESAAAQNALELAQTALANAQGMMTAAAGELPGDSTSPLPGLVEIITIVRALMTGDWVFVGIILIRIAVPLGIDFLVKWIGGKLPGRKTPPTQAELQKIAESIQDLALRETVFKMSDNMELYQKSLALKY